MMILNQILQQLRKMRKRSPLIVKVAVIHQTAVKIIHLVLAKMAVLNLHDKKCVPFDALYNQIKLLFRLKLLLSLFYLYLLN